LGGAAFRFQFLGNGAALLFDLVAHLVTARKGEGVPIKVFKPGEGTTPAWCLWRMIKANPALAPLAELGSDVLGHKNNVPAPTNELIFLGVGLRSNLVETLQALLCVNKDTGESRDTNHRTGRIAWMIAAQQSLRLNIRIR
jgi:hypothetical protein